MKSNGLELYAKIEDMLDFTDAIRKLYGAFYKELKGLGAKSVVDIGCGSGAFGLGLVCEGYSVLGVDISVKMVQNAQNAGLNARHIDVCELDEKFDAATAVFDVLNYMNKDELEKFFACVRNALNDGGYFFADINSFYGFDEVAQSVISTEKDDRYAVVEAGFDEEILTTTINLFSKQENGLYEREEGEIVQYYHDKKSIEKLSGMKVVRIVKIGLYGDEADKYLYIFKKI